MTALKDVRDEFTQLWGQMGPLWGVSPATARVYGWLIGQQDPADAESIRAGLQMSRGAVSMACRELQDWGLVFPERVPGSRRVSYRPETDLEKAIRSIVQTRKRREWDPMKERIAACLDSLRGERSKEAQVFRERLQDIGSIVGVADSLADQFLKGGVLAKFGLKALVRRARRAQKSRG